MKKALVFACLLLAANLAAQSRRTFAKEFNPLSINAQFGVQMPLADMARRFGMNFGVGGGVEYTRIPTGWLFGIDANYLFGQDVKEDVLAAIRTKDGGILGDANTYSDVALRERGLYVGGMVGKIFKLHDNGNKFGGIRLTVSAGWLYHQIRIQDNSGAAPQVADVYAAGYDRFTAGVALTQFIGYQIISRDRTVNFTVGFDFTEGFTKNQRGFNFDTGARDDRTRSDFLYGFRVGWQLPIFTNSKAEDIEY